MDWKQSLVEALRVAFRTAWMASFPIIIMGLQTGSVDWKAAGFAALIALLMAADKFVNKWDGTTLKGLSPL